MAVVIDSGAITATQRREDVPVDRWRELVAVRRDFCAVNLSYDCRELLHFVDDASAMLAPLGYADLRDFIARGLELNPDMVNWAVQGLKQLKPDEPIPFKTAVQAALDAAPKIMTAVEAGKKGGRGKRVTSLVTLSTGGNDRIAARLKHDHPDICARIEKGEFTSIRAAAIAAGIIKVKTPLEQLRHWWHKADHVAQQTFREEIAR